MVTFSHRVRYHEVDRQDIFFNGRYIELADVGLTEFVRTLGWTYPQLNALGVDPSVVHIDADFTAPARFDDVLDVHTECTRIGRSSFDLRNLIERGDTTLATITVTYVNVSPTVESAVEIPAPFALALAASLTAKESRDE